VFSIFTSSFRVKSNHCSHSMAEFPSKSYWGIIRSLTLANFYTRCGEDDTEIPDKQISYRVDACLPDDRETRQFSGLIKGGKAESSRAPAEKKNCAISRIGTDYLLDGHKRLRNTVATTPTNLPEHTIMGLYDISHGANPIVRTSNWLNRCSTAICPDGQQADLAFGPKFCPDRQPGSIRIIRGPQNAHSLERFCCTNF
jgi:hypothetical protein